MENNGNQNLASSLCKTGCGFFGNPQFDGMCSKCYKDSVKRKQAAPADSVSILPTASASTVQMSPAAVAAAAAAVTAAVPDTTPSVEAGQPTVPAFKVEALAAAGGGGASSSEETDGAESPAKGKKRNRCYTCKKKVGLTGFECRCGGLYCSMHRYSDKHACQFDYREHGADHIRKNNPMVVGEKVQKL